MAKRHISEPSAHPGNQHRVPLEITRNDCVAPQSKRGKVLNPVDKLKIHPQKNGPTMTLPSCARDWRAARIPMDRAAFGSSGPGNARSKDSRPSTWRFSFCARNFVGSYCGGSGIRRNDRRARTQSSANMFSIFLDAAPSTAPATKGYGPAGGSSWLVSAGPIRQEGFIASSTAKVPKGPPGFVSMRPCTGERNYLIRLRRHPRPASHDGRGSASS